MIVCDGFVFLHLHKSGGTFVNELLLNCEPSARRLGYHLPYHALPAAHRAKPVLGTVRNPYEYYVSWYAFQSSQRRPNPLFLLCSRDGTRDFSATIEALLGLESDCAAFAALRARLPDAFREAGLNLTKTCLDPLAGSGLGFYTFLHDRLYAGARTPQIVKTSQIRTGLIPILERLGCTARARMTLFMEQVPALNRSTHGEVDTYYSADLRRRIATADAPLIARYEFD